MIVDVNGNQQPPVGTQPHWTMLTSISEQADIFEPIVEQIVIIVDAAVAANHDRPSIDSRQACEAAITGLNSWWHGEFSRRFAQFPNGSLRGILGMCLWNYLALIDNETWCFSSIPDSHGYGQDAKQYWRS